MLIQWEINPTNLILLNDACNNRYTNIAYDITTDSHIPYFRYYKTPLYLFLRPFGHSSRPRTRFFLVSLELLVRLLFKRVLYSRASYNSENTVFVLISY